MRRVSEMLGSAAIVVGISSLVYIAMFARDLVLASQFGRSAELDSFLIALILPNYLISAVGGSLATAIVPFYVRAVHVGVGAKDRFFIRAGVATTAATSLGTILLAAVVLAWHEEFQSIGLVSNLSGWMFCLTVFGVVASVLTALGNVDRRLVLSSIAPAASPVLVVLTILYVGGRVTVEVVAVATIIGAGLQCMLLALPATVTKRVFEEWYPKLSWRLPRGFAEAFLPLLLGSVIMSMMTAIDQVFAHRFGVGAVSTVSFAGKIVLTVAALITTALSAIALPEFSKFAHSGDWRGLAGQVRRIGILSFTVSTLAAVAIVLFSSDLVNLLFQRGQFSATDTAEVANLQTWYAFQLPFYCVAIVYSRALAAIGRTRILLLGNILAVSVKVLLNLLLADKMGIDVIALSTSVTYAACLAFLWLAYNSIVAGVTMRTNDQRENG